MVEELQLLARKQRGRIQVLQGKSKRCRLADEKHPTIYAARNANNQLDAQAKRPYNAEESMKGAVHLIREWSAAARQEHKTNLPGFVGMSRTEECEAGFARLWIFLFTRIHWNSLGLTRTH